MMENWVADSKRGPLQHAPEGSAATQQEKSEKMRQETRCNTLGDTREGISHNATNHGATKPSCRESTLSKRAPA